MERAIKEKMTTLDIESAMPQDLINAKPLTVSLKDFLQVLNYLSLWTASHYRVLIKDEFLLGPGGLTRERAGFEVRDASNHYGGFYSIETLRDQILV